jgi:hypothetical protein
MRLRAKYIGPKTRSNYDSVPQLRRRTEYYVPQDVRVSLCFGRQRKK